MSRDLVLWDDVFTIVKREKVGGGSKVDPADRFTWEGFWKGRTLVVISYVRDINPTRSFNTSSSARINYNPKIEHYVELSSKQQLTIDEKLELIELARTVETRPIFWKVT